MSGQSRFLAPEFEVVQNRRISPLVVGKIKRDTAMRAELGQRQCIVLILGSNNLRWAGSPAAVNQLFREVVEHFASLPGAFLVLTSPLPSPEADEESKVRYEALAKELNNLHNEFPSTCSFQRTSRIFAPNGNIDLDKTHRLKNQSKLEVKKSDIVHKIHK